MTWPEDQFNAGHRSNPLDQIVEAYRYVETSQEVGYVDRSIGLAGSYEPYATPTSGVRTRVGQ